MEMNFLLNGTVSALMPHQIHDLGHKNRSRDTIDTIVLLSSIIDILSYYYIPIVCATGLVFNTLALFIARKTSLRHLSITPHLSVLTVTDNAFLTVQMLFWVKYTHHISWVSTAAVCQGAWFVLYLSGFLSTWTCVAILTDRLISMCNNDQHGDFCNPYKSFCVNGIFGFCGLLFYSTTLWTAGPTPSIDGSTTCAFLKQYVDILKTFTQLDNFFFAVLPYVLLPGLNLILIFLLCQRNCHIKGQSSQFIVSDHEDDQYQLTKAFVITMTVLWLLGMASFWQRMKQFFMMTYGLEYESSVTEQQYYIIFLYCYFTGFSIKFFLYTITCKAFREGIKEFFQVSSYPQSSLQNNVYTGLSENTSVGNYVDHETQV